MFSSLFLMVWKLLLLVSPDKVIKVVKSGFLVTLVTQIYKHAYYEKISK